MDFDDQNVDVGGVDDQRGLGGGGGLGGLGGRGVAIGGGGGILALVVTVLILVLGGGGGLPQGALGPGSFDGQSIDGTGAGQSTDELRTRCNTEGAIERYEDCFLIKVYNETNEVWSKQLGTQGVSWQRPALTFFSGSTRTGCGSATSQVGPFYCPADQSIYLDIDFLQQLQQQVGAQGRYAQAYILAHEYGHHLQTLLGIEPRVRQQQQADPRQVNALSVRLELQADCFAGVWGRLANDQGNVSVTPGDIQEAQRAAAAVGDDRLAKAAGRRVNPESWTHGSAADRQRWFTTGYGSGDVTACDTFSA